MEFWEQLFSRLASLAAWGEAHYYGMLALITVIAFVIRRKVIHLTLSVLSPFADGAFFKAVKETFVRPLEFLFVALVAIAFIKALPSQVNSTSIYNIFGTILLLCLFWILGRLTNLYSEKLQKLYRAFDAQLSKELAQLITNIVRVLLATMAIFTIMDLWGINVAALLGGLGIVSAAVAFASQDTIKNVFGSFTVLADRTFAVGDRISIDTVEGNVEDIGLRSTTIRKSDQSLVMIPNGNLVNAPVTNFSRIHFRMVQLNLHFDLENDLSAIQDFLSLMKTNIRNYPLFTEAHDAVPLLVFVDHIQSEGLVVSMRFFINKNDYEALCLAKEAVLLQSYELAHRLGLSFYKDTLSAGSTKRRQ